MNKFTLDPTEAALIVIDMQEFACGGIEKPRQGELERVIDTINRLAGTSRDRGIPVIWVRQNINTFKDGDDGGFYGLFHDEDRTRMIMDYGPGTEIAGSMNPDLERDHVVFKNRYSAFLSKPPELQLKLEELGRRQLLITGIAANVCVESTLRDAMQLDYEVILVSDGTMGTDDEAYRSTVNNTRMFFGDVLKAEEIIKQLR